MPTKHSSPYRKFAKQRPETRRQMFLDALTKDLLDLLDAARQRVNELRTDVNFWERFDAIKQTDIDIGKVLVEFDEYVMRMMEKKKLYTSATCGETCFSRSWKRARRSGTIRLSWKRAGRGRTLSK